MLYGNKMRTSHQPVNKTERSSQLHRNCEISNHGIISISDERIKFLNPSNPKESSTHFIITAMGPPIPFPTISNKLEQLQKYTSSTDKLASSIWIHINNITTGRETSRAQYITTHYLPIIPQQKIFLWHFLTRPNEITCKRKTFLQNQFPVL